MSHDTAERLVPAPRLPESDGPTPQDKRRRGLGRGAIIALAAGGVVVLAVAAGAVLLAPKPGGAIVDPDADDEISDGNTGGEHAPVVYTVESLEVSSEQPPEDQGEAIIALLDEWSMAGANQGTYEAYLKALASGTSAGEFARQEAEKYGPIFAEAIFGPDWESDPGIVNMVRGEGGRIDLNADFLENWLITSQDEVPFQASSTDVQISGVVDNGTTIDEDITFTRDNNAALNRIGSEYNPEMIALDGTVVNVHIQIVKAGDVAYLGFYSDQS